MNKPPAACPAPAAVLPEVALELPGAVPAAVGRRKPLPAAPKDVATFAGTPWLSRQDVNFARAADAVPAADVGAEVEVGVVWADVFVDPPPHEATSKPAATITAIIEGELRQGGLGTVSERLRAGVESIGPILRRTI